VDLTVILFTQAKYYD